ncbi:extracellular solute-binding protein [Jiangella aurantiaca]|uniref:Extracellular solute-binding protein n=1 Tax=Jiangella aurantiaca TaxID=2530373 RepID=A0A4R5AEN1_9ACTN|nr:sugar ABC transporter substrate-binding protein [Jiangella aurantiaca]TDD70993.1 extracellular solute-binding protein [Jiangella aurantiaca]
MSRRHISAATALAVATALALAACGREDDEGSDGNAAPSADITEGPATGTIEVWAMGTEGEELGAFLADFEEANPDATVEVTPVPWEGAHDRIATAIAAGETPDVSLIGTTWMGEFAQTGGLEPTPTDLFDENDFFPGPWASTVVDGTSYGVPWYVETRALFYRTDLAEAAGLEPPQTWDDLKAFAQGLQQAGAQQGIYLQPGQSGSWQTFMPFAWQNGATLTDGDAYTLDSPEMTEALEYYTSYFTEGLSQDTVLQPGALEQMFADGAIGSFISGPWHIGLVRDAGATDNFDVVPLPGKDEAPGTSFVGGGNLAVFTDSDNKSGAWKLIEYLTQVEVQQSWYETLTDLPSKPAAWEDGPLTEDPLVAVFGEQLESTEAPPAVPTWEQVASVIDADVEAAVRGAMSPADAVADMQSQASSIGTGLQ